MPRLGSRERRGQVGEARGRGSRTKEDGGLVRGALGPAQIPVKVPFTLTVLGFVLSSVTVSSWVR